jgi:hypothetical protein
VPNVVGHKCFALKNSNLLHFALIINNWRKEEVKETEIIKVIQTWSINQTQHTHVSIQQCKNFSKQYTLSREQFFYQGL